MRPIAYLLTVLLLAPLAGCLTMSGSPEETAQGPAGAQQQAMIVPPEPGLTPSERYRKSLSLLEAGEADQAMAELREYLRVEPGGRYAKRSRDLLRQIEVDPQEELGEEHFLYTMQRGDSLSSVSKRYLDDALKFYVLARYNDLDNPSQVKVGQVIKVPGEERPGEVQQAAQAAPPEEPSAEAEEAADAGEELAEDSSSMAVPEAPDASGATAMQLAEEGPEAAPEDPMSAPAEDMAEEATDKPTDDMAAEPPSDGPAQEQVAARPEGESAEPSPEANQTQIEDDVGRIQEAILKAEEPATKGDYQAAAREYETALKQFPDDLMIKQLAAANYVTFADQLMDKGRFDDASIALERAAELHPESADVKQRLVALERREEANELYAEGKKLLAADQPVEAYEKFDEVIKIVPDHPAVREHADLEPVVVEEYHRKAMIFFRRQDLDAALGVWDTKVLVIDPTYEPALLYRAQAIELQERLDDIPNDQPAEQ